MLYSEDRHGKSGYQLGNAKSPLSQGQILQILASLSEVAPNSVQPTLASLAPLMNEEDLKMIKGVIAMAGSIAGAFYGIDDSLVEEALERIDDDEMLKTIAAFAETVEKKE